MLCRLAARASAPSLALARGRSILTPTATATALTTTAIQARHSSSSSDPPDSLALPFPWRPKDMRLTERDLYLKYGDSYIWHLHGRNARQLAVEAFDNRRRMAKTLRLRLGDDWYWIMVEAARRTTIEHRSPERIEAKRALREEARKGKSGDELEASVSACAKELRALDWKIQEDLRIQVKMELEQGTLTIEEIKERPDGWMSSVSERRPSSKSERQPTSSEPEHQPTSSESEHQSTSSESEHQPTSSTSEHQSTSSAL